LGEEAGECRKKAVVLFYKAKKSGQDFAEQKGAE
jgi:hypothetical protein